MKRYMKMMELFLKTQLTVTVTVFWNVMSCSLYITGKENVKCNNN